MPDAFYAIERLPRAAQADRLRLAHGLCEHWWLDKLDCRESFRRQLVDGATFEDAMSHFVAGALAVVIHRRRAQWGEPDYIEVGFRSMESPVDYFLWIVVPLEKAELVLAGLDVR